MKTSVEQENIKNFYFIKTTTTLSLGEFRENLDCNDKLEILRGQNKIDLGLYLEEIEEKINNDLWRNGKIIFSIDCNISETDFQNIYFYDNLDESIEPIKTFESKVPYTKYETNGEDDEYYWHTIIIEL